MKRKIGWNSREFDEIESVYDKAAENETIGNLLELLEAQALSEAKSNCSLLTTDKGNHITSEQFDDLSENDKEIIIRVLAGIGLSSINQNIQSATIIIRLSAKIQQVMACTVFDILNRLEKLDGAINMLIPKWTLEFQVPLGGKKGLFQWEMLIMQLYPWISIKETATNEMASELIPFTSGNSEKTKEKTEKPEEEKLSVNFFKHMVTKEAFVTTYELAKAELGIAIQKRQFTPSISGKNVSYEQWGQLEEMDKLNLVLAMGNHAISNKVCTCIDFAELIPNCIAIMLLYSVWSGQKKEYLIDAGDGTDVTKFVEALNRIHNCCEPWKCTIAHPISVKIGVQDQISSVNGTKEKKEKKSFLKKLFSKS